MKILLGTQIFLWMFLEPSRISSTVESLLKNRANELFLSAASAWEIAVKYNAGKLELPEAPPVYVPDRMKRANLKKLDITHEKALSVVHCSLFTKTRLTEC